MRLLVIILIAFTIFAISGRVLGQSAFVDDGQDGAAIGLLYTDQNRINGFGVEASLSSRGQADINASIVSIGRAGESRKIVIGVGATPFLRSNPTGGVSALFGLPVGVAYTTQSGGSNAAMIGIASEVSILEGQRARLVLSGGLSRVFLLDCDAGNSTVWTAGVGQSIPAGTLLFVLGVSVSQSTDSGSDSQVAFHLDFLFTR